MVDVIGRCRAVSAVVTVYKYHTWGVPPLSFLMLTHSTYQPFHLEHLQPLDSVCLFHILRRLPCAIYLHSSLQVSAFLCEAHRHGSICLNFSFPVWGVYPIPCSRAQHTSNTRAAQNEKRGQKGDIQKAYKWGNDGESRYEWERGVCLCGENQDEHVRTVEWKILSDDTETVKTKGKWKRSGKYKVVNYHNIHRYGQIRPDSCQRLSSYRKIVFFF